VNTMPESTLRAVADHGEVPEDSVRAHYGDAQQVLDHLQALGIDYNDVVQGLEDDAVDKFDASWDELGRQLTTMLSAGSAPA
jgi:transaldolase